MSATITNIAIPMNQYPILLDGLKRLPEELRRGRLRNLARTDLYFLLRYGLARPDIEHPWVFERCREVQKAPDGYLDLWAREHYKSTIITFAKTIQDILASHGDEPLADRECTVGIFSHTRPIAKGFLRQIMREFESNDWLRTLFPDIVWDNCKREAPKWSEDDGIVLKRKSNPKESTVEAWGLVDSQPTSKHFSIRVYDDVVTKESVGTPDMIAKTTSAWELSLNLGTRGGAERYIGTRYHFSDTYKEMMRRTAAEPREHYATTNGEVDGEPVLLTREELIEKRKKMGPYTFGCQMLQNPKADKAQGFQLDWLKYYEQHNNGKGMNIVILVDPANEKKKKSDYTSMKVLGFGADENDYVLDMVRDKLNLKERTDTLFELHKRWKQPGQKLDVYYEKYGKDSDIDHIIGEMERENYRFDIYPIGGQMAKNDRIRRLVPDFEQGTILLPRKLLYVDREGITRDLVQEFINDEYEPFPVGDHDDMLDTLARKKDINVVYPVAAKSTPIPRAKRGFSSGRR